MLELTFQQVTYEQVKPLRRSSENAIIHREDDWFALCAEGQIAAVMGLSPPRRNVTKVHGAFTVPEHRRRGLYTALLIAVAEHVDRTMPWLEIRADSLPEGVGSLVKAGFVEFRPTRQFKKFSIIYMRRPCLNARALS